MILRDASCLVGQRDGRDVVMTGLGNPGDPLAEAVIFPLRRPHDGSRTVDQQRAQVGIATFADTQQSLLASI